MDMEETKQVLEETKQVFGWLENISWERVIFSAVVVVAAIVLWLLIRMSFRRWKRKKGGKLAGNSGTAITLAYSLLRALLVFFVLVWVLQINGINVTSMLAGIGLAGAIIGLAFQDYLKDIIMGVHIVTDDFFKVGDAIEYGGDAGIVTAFNLRSTKIRSTTDGSIFTISNRNVSEIRKQSHLVMLNVPLPYEADFRKVHEVLKDAARRIGALRDVESCEYKGTQTFGDSAIIYRIHFFCPPEKKWDAWRAAHMVLQEALEEANLQVPYQQIDVHNIPQ